ncbi:protein THEM6 [Rhinatrema bivittatum]|uniref:protein THEM6 n=1 Tax=Rhinatrema bivittatum TaxID=194408 RepID=UPI001129AED1|nr:protein THEM6 [Rhinatrema bivittatum]
MWALLTALSAAAFFALLDGWYFLRASLVLARSRLQPAVRDLLREHSFSGLVLPHDLDLLLHMNNARYLREADLARFAHFTRSGLLGALRALGAGIVMGGCAVRYRRSLRLLQRFHIRSRLLCWDERAFYVEQRFVTPADGFVCAVLLNRQHVQGSSPEQVVQFLCKKKVESPEFPEEVKHWISYNETSSQKLRAESGIGSDPKNQ